MNVTKGDLQGIVDEINILGSKLEELLLGKGGDNVETGNKVLRSIYIKTSQLEDLKKLSADTGVPQAVYVREGLDYIIEKYKEKGGDDNDLGKVEKE